MRLFRPSRFSRTGQLWTALQAFSLFLLLVSGCGRGTNSPTETTTPAQVSTEIVDDATSISSSEHGQSTATGQDAGGTPRISVAPLHLPGDKLLAETAVPNWESEEYGVRAAAHLDTIIKTIHGPSAIDRRAVSALVHQDFRCSLLRPEKLQEVFRDEVFSVLRPPHTTEGNDTVSEFAGPTGILQALASFAEPLRRAEQIRVEQKVIRVAVQDAKVDTVSLIHAIGKTQNGSVQQNTAWACQWQRLPDDDLKLLSVRATDYEEVRATLTRPFVDCTQAAIGDSLYYKQILAYGIDHWLDRIETRYGLDASGWEGIAVGDANGDGRDDVYVCQPGGLANGLLVQQADGTAEDVAKWAGVDVLDQTNSALFVDLDNDGDQDLVLAIAMGIVVYSNDGQGTFSSRAAKLVPEGVPLSLSAADYDLDGDLDLYVCCYSKRRSVVSHHFMGRPLPYHDANNGARNLLLRNNRDWRFQDVTQRVGLSQNNQRFSFAAAWEDYDNDGDLDLYVANDYGRNSLYRNTDGNFADVASQAGVEDMAAGMSVSWGDIDNDGSMDLYVSNMFSSAGNRVAYQRQFQPGADAATRAGLQRHARGNSLFTGNRSGNFRDISELAAVTMGRWAWGSTLADLNNDGLKDIVVANGFLTQEFPDDL